MQSDWPLLKCQQTLTKKCPLCYCHEGKIQFKLINILIRKFQMLIIFGIHLPHYHVVNKITFNHILLSEVQKSETTNWIKCFFIWNHMLSIIKFEFKVELKCEQEFLNAFLQNGTLCYIYSPSCCSKPVFTKNLVSFFFYSNLLFLYYIIDTFTCWKLCSSKVENSEEKTRRLRIRSSAEFLYSMTCVVICSHRRSPLSHFYRVSYRQNWRRDFYRLRQNIK